MNQFASVQVNGTIVIPIDDASKLLKILANATQLDGWGDSRKLSENLSTNIELVPSTTMEILKQGQLLDKTYGEMIDGTD